MADREGRKHGFWWRMLRGTLALAIRFFAAGVVLIALAIVVSAFL